MQTATRARRHSVLSSACTPRSSSARYPGIICGLAADGGFNRSDCDLAQDDGPRGRLEDACQRSLRSVEPTGNLRRKSHDRQDAVVAATRNDTANSLR